MLQLRTFSYSRIEGQSRTQRSKLACVRIFQGRFSYFFSFIYIMYSTQRRCLFFRKCFDVQVRYFLRRKILLNRSLGNNFAISLTALEWMNEK